MSETTGAFTKTKKILEVIELVNLVDTEKFELLIDRILTGLQSKKAEIFTEKEL
jgi:hypothetical protein